MNRGTSSHQNEMLPFYVSVNNVNAQICTFHVTFTLNVYELAFMSDSEPDVSMFSSLSVDTNWYFQVKHDVFLTGWFLCLSVCNRSGEQLCVCGFRNVDYQDIFQLSGFGTSSCWCKNSKSQILLLTNCRCVYSGLTQPTQHDPLRSVWWVTGWLQP